jgi:signal transduction histidine kinase
MVVQADAAGFLLPTATEEPATDPAAAGRVAENLTAISATGRRALTELRTLLHVLDGVPDAGRPLAVGEISELVEQARAAGQPVEFSRAGSPRPLGDGVELAAYRVVQEALTNAVKHAPGRRTVVRIAHADEAVEVSVDTAPGPASGPVGGSGGRGLVGLRERVDALGGHFTATPGVDGGFAVHARIPVGPQ